MVSVSIYRHKKAALPLILIYLLFPAHSPTLILSFLPTNACLLFSTIICTETDNGNQAMSTENEGR